jgi:hypothetical protein
MAARLQGNQRPRRPRRDRQALRRALLRYRVGEEIIRLESLSEGFSFVAVVG